LRTGGQGELHCQNWLRRSEAGCLDGPTARRLTWCWRRARLAFCWLIPGHGKVDELTLGIDRRCCVEPTSGSSSPPAPRSWLWNGLPGARSFLPTTSACRPLWCGPSASEHLRLALTPSIRPKGCMVRVFQGLRHGTGALIVQPLWRAESASWCQSAVAQVPLELCEQNSSLPCLPRDLRRLTHQPVKRPVSVKTNAQRQGRLQENKHLRKEFLRNEAWIRFPPVRKQEGADCIPCRWFVSFRDLPSPLRSGPSASFECSACPSRAPQLRSGSGVLRMSEQALSHLASTPWPGSMSRASSPSRRPSKT